MKTIGYAVVGTGYFGAELARIMKEQEGARVVAVYDPENAGTVAAEVVTRRRTWTGYTAVKTWTR